MTTQQSIPLSQLVHSAANVRRTGQRDGIPALAASIAAHGLRQNLNVQPSADGRRFEVVAGGRRLRALKLLAKEGKLSRSAPVACRVLDEADDPAEISLAENALRLAMHPDDQCDAFRALIDEKGIPVEDVAARFGVTPVLVRQRLRLAGVSPRLRALYRKGELTLDHMMALTIRDDHAAQEAAWKSLPEWNRSPLALRRSLTQDAVPLTDKLARLVGIDAYEAAGGVVLRDLFDAEAGYLPDRPLVERLAAEKMADTVTAVQAEGWKWVEPRQTRDYTTPYGRVYPTRDEAGTAIYAPEDMARAGAFVTLDHDGTLSVERGLVHPSDVEKIARPKGQTVPSGLSAALVEDLTAHRTAALRIELTRNPSVALAAAVHALALPLLYPYGTRSCLAVRASSEPLERHTAHPEDSPAHTAMAEEGDRWGDRLPGDGDDFFTWCLAEPQDTLLDLLAYVVGLTVDAVRLRHEGGQLDHADRLADALGLDMRPWWTPSVEGFFARLPKAALTQAIAEAEVPPLGYGFGAITKAEAARATAKALAGSGWLPAPLRGMASPTAGD